jgi:hypothetical protein
VRKALVKHQRERQVFSGVYSHYYIAERATKFRHVVFLARNVCFQSGKWVSDHVWVITNWRGWPIRLSNLKGGETLIFEAEVRSYLKRKLVRGRNGKGNIVTKVEWVTSYGLRYPSLEGLKVVSVLVPSEVEVQRLQQELDFLALCLE